MSRRRNGTNRAAALLGVNRNKLGSRKHPGLWQTGEEIHYRYDRRTGQYKRSSKGMQV